MARIKIEDIRAEVEKDKWKVAFLVDILKTVKGKVDISV